MTRSSYQPPRPLTVTDTKGEPISQHAVGPSIHASGLPRTIRRRELRTIVPLAYSTIYELEQRGQFPRRFNLTPRCVVWDLGEVEAWLRQRRRDSLADQIVRAPKPNVRQRKTRPVKG